MKIDIRKVGRFDVRGEQLVLTPSFACYQKILEETGKTVAQLAVDFHENHASITPMQIATIVWASQWNGIKNPPINDIEHYGELLVSYGYNNAYREVLTWLFGSIAGWDETIATVDETPEEKKS